MVQRRPLQPSINIGAAEASSETERIGGELRQAMANWPSGVAVLAVVERQRIEAITINSLISVSLQPPLVMVSIAESAQIRPMLENSARMTISLLAADQARVASMVADRVPNLPTLFSPPPDPVIRDSVASLGCTLSQTYVAGDHVLCLCSVESVRLGRDVPPLVYVHGRYGRLEDR